MIPRDVFKSPESYEFAHRGLKARVVRLMCLCVAILCNLAILLKIQVEPGKPGAEVLKKKTISQRKYLPIECAQGDQPLRCPNRVV